MQIVHFVVGPLKGLASMWANNLLKRSMAFSHCVFLALCILKVERSNPFFIGGGVGGAYALPQPWFLVLGLVFLVYIFTYFIPKSNFKAEWVFQF